MLVFPSADELTKQALSLSVAKKDLMLCKDGPQAGRVTVIMLQLREDQGAGQHIIKNFTTSLCRSITSELSLSEISV